jgi:hypothetical protein
MVLLCYWCGGTHRACRFKFNMHIAQSKRPDRVSGQEPIMIYTGG